MEKDVPKVSRCQMYAKKAKTEPKVKKDQEARDDEKKGSKG